MIIIMITKHELRKILRYEPETGLFYWRVKMPPRGFIGKTAGFYSCGYWRISVGGKKFYAHQLAFLWMTGRIPKEIDHADQNRGNNKWGNIRSSNRVSNCHNVSGRIGVRRRYGRWYARIVVNNKATHLGVFQTKEEARGAYTAAQKDAMQHQEHCKSSTTASVA